jgi:peptide chain release factor subunit 1
MRHAKAVDFNVSLFFDTRGWAWLLRQYSCSFFCKQPFLRPRGLPQINGSIMISHNDVARLASLKSDHGILSAYVRIDPRLRFMRQQATSQFKGAAKAAQRRALEKRWQEALERESIEVINFLSNWEPAGRGLAIFTSRPEGLWEVVPLDILVPNLVEIDTTTKTAVLWAMLEKQSRFVVAVLQRDKARIYIAEQGTADEPVELASEVPGQHNQGGWSQMRFQRHIDFHVTEHLKKVVDEIKSFAEAGPFTLAFGGTEETVSDTLKMLPPSLASKVIGRFPVDYKHDTEQEILRRAVLLRAQQEELQEEKLVDQVFDAAQSSAQGVVGIERTLRALTEEKVRTLLLADGVVISASVCTRCDYFSAMTFESCPLCGATAQRRDVSDRAVEKAFLTGAEAQVVSSDGAKARLFAEGGMAALLRY